MKLAPTVVVVLVLAAPIALGPVSAAEPTRGSWYPAWQETLDRADAARERGDIDRAEATYREALEVARTHAPGSLRYARSVDALADLLMEAERYDEAEPLYLESIALFESLLGPEQPRLGTSLHNLAVLYYRTERYDRVREPILRAVSIWESAFGGDHPQVAGSLRVWANVLRRTDRLAEAEALETRIREIRENGAAR